MRGETKANLRPKNTAYFGIVRAAQGKPVGTASTKNYVIELPMKSSPMNGTSFNVIRPNDPAAGVKLSYGGIFPLLDLWDGRYLND
jgi:hypothetical protein